MSFKRSLMLGFVLVLVSFALDAWLYPHIPDPMPRRWDLAGHVVAYGPKSQFVFLQSAVMAATWLLLLVLPRISPHGFRMDQFLDVFGVVSAGLIAVLSFLNAIVLLQAAGHVLPLSAMIFVAIGLLMAFLGNYMGKLRKNFFIGVRTPWTLASDEVWARTHRLTGWVFAAAGLAIAADGMLGANVPFFCAVIIGAVLTPLVYSYVLYGRIEGFGPDPSA
jgi:uncharacterized membrane protein